MQKELQFLEQSDLESILERVDSYLDYIFETDKPEILLKKEYPTFWTIYILGYLDSQIENGGFRQFLWNSNARFNDDLLEALKLVESQDYLDTFREILVRFDSDPEERRQFLSNEFSDESSRNIRNDLREITWAFTDRVYAGEVPSLITKIEQYIRSNHEVLAKELARIRTNFVDRI